MIVTLGLLREQHFAHTPISHVSLNMSLYVYWFVVKCKIVCPSWIEILLKMAFCLYVYQGDESC